MATVFIDYRTISWGAANEDDSTDVWQVEDGTKDSGEILLASFGNVASPINNWYAQDPSVLAGNSYQFAFWNATDGASALAGFPSSNPLNIPDLPPGVVQATAWFALPGGSGPGGGPALRARTFDVDLNNFRKETPIQSVTPQAAWPGPNNHSASTQTANVTVTPKGTLNFPAASAQQPPGELPKYFQHWQTIVGPAQIAAAPGQTIQCAQNQTALAVAFYSHQKPQKPPIGKPATGSVYDYWAEFWGKRGAEGEGPFGPLGPGTPWGPAIARALAELSPVEQGMVLGALNALFKSANIKGGNVKG